jgi:RNA polymerase sigma-70 factor (ECF subfamily)
MDDRDAIARCLDGDADVFRVLVDRYQARAFGHARFLSGSDADAADAAQDAFIDAYRALDRFDRARPFYPWFYVLLRNRCAKQRSRPATRAESQELSPAVAAAAPDLDASLDLERALDQLEPDEREIVMLKHIDGWKYSEIAERIGIPAGTVMSRLFTARQKLRAALEGGST